MNGTTKIGGLIINSQIDGDTAICNIGCGLNLSNSSPTVCIYDLIKQIDGSETVLLPTYEKMLASIFNEIEILLDTVQTNGIDTLYDQYYAIWIHSDSDVTILDKTGNKKLMKIVGIDDFGYLCVQREGHAPETVHPDGNTFDMIRGLIMPK